MIVVKVELHPFGDETKAKNISNVLIWNKGGTRERGEYGTAVLPEGMSVSEGRDIIRNKEFDKLICNGEVKNYPRLDLPIEELVTASLLAMDYGPVWLK